MRGLTLGILAGASIGLASFPALAQVTTRIEGRPFYGATVTLEEGVRVFRPLPPHDRVIINPGYKTPLSLGFYESRNYNYNYADNDAYIAPPGTYPYPYYGTFGTFRGNKHRGFRHHGGRHGHRVGGFGR
jgi:hypothetical protein